MLVSEARNTNPVRPLLGLGSYTPLRLFSFLLSSAWFRFTMVVIRVLTLMSLNNDVSNSSKSLDISSLLIYLPYTSTLSPFITRTLDDGLQHVSCNRSEVKFCPQISHLNIHLSRHPDYLSSTLLVLVIYFALGTFDEIIQPYEPSGSLS
jgi:hypothetical protein